MQNCDKLFKETRTKKMLIGLPADNLNVKLTAHGTANTVEELRGFGKSISSWQVKLLKANGMTIKEIEMMTIMFDLTVDGDINDIDISVE